MDRAQAQGQTLAQFQADLEPLLRKRGWWGRQTVVGPESKRDLAGATPATLARACGPVRPPGRQARREASPRTEKVGLSPTSLPT